MSDSLNLGQATLAVAREGAETVTDLLTQIKGKVVAAQEENVDRDKIQADIAALRDQIGSIVVTTQAGVDSALNEMEGLIQTAIEAAASFGSAGMRLDTQKEFISGLTDALQSDIGALVDADLEEVSARLQAQQVQQQMAMQALSIANQSPRALLSLFR